MNVLVACEFSGIVRDAFLSKGHHAISIDLIESERPGPHIIDNVLNHLNKDWHLLIAFPPCTYLAASGLHWTTRGLRDPQKTTDAIAFVEALWNAPIPRIAIENPVGCLSTRSSLGKRYQTIHPYLFGHDHAKTTCLWLKHLPPLQSTSFVQPKIINGKRRWANQCLAHGQDRTGPSPDRWKIRSRTFPGIALAMAHQWSL